MLSRKLASLPTIALPGSVLKLAVMAARRRYRLLLFVVGDAVLPERLAFRPQLLRADEAARAALLEEGFAGPETIAESTTYSPTPRPRRPCERNPTDEYRRRDRERKKQVQLAKAAAAGLKLSKLQSKGA